MGFEEKKERAISIMKSKKMWGSNYVLPLLRLAWKIGIRIPPLPFAPFWQVALLTGIPIGSVWGILMWFFTWKDGGMLPADAIARSIFADLCTGIFMALYHWWRRVFNNLPDWNNLGRLFEFFSGPVSIIAKPGHVVAVRSQSLPVFYQLR